MAQYAKVSRAALASMPATNWYISNALALGEPGLEPTHSRMPAKRLLFPKERRSHEQLKDKLPNHTQLAARRQAPASTSINDLPFPSTTTITRRNSTSRKQHRSGLLGSAVGQFFPPWPSSHHFSLRHCSPALALKIVLTFTELQATVT